MKRNDTYNLINATNYAALCIAILRPASVEDAFEVYESDVRIPKVEHYARMHMIYEYRKEGLTWKEIGNIFKLKEPRTYYFRHKNYLKEDKND